MTTCIGCGCTDEEACETESGGACHWLIKNVDFGVCSECPGHVPRFEMGDFSLFDRDDDDDEEPGLILPGDDEYDDTLAHLRARRPA